VAVNSRLVVLDLVKDEHFVEGAEEHLGVRATRQSASARHKRSHDLLGADERVADNLEPANGAGG
jgi:hypothetical protein